MISYSLPYPVVLIMNKCAVLMTTFVYPGSHCSVPVAMVTTDYTPFESLFHGLSFDISHLYHTLSYTISMKV